MAAFIVTYDLNKQGQNYNCIIEKLKELDGFHLQQSVWILNSELAVKDIRDLLANCLDTNDSLFVGKLSAGAWKGLRDDVGKWLVAIIR